QKRHGFSAVPCDMTIEQTANRDSKTKGGLIGNTLNRGYMHRWLLSQHHRTAITRRCQEMAGVSRYDRSKRNLDKTFRVKHEKHVNSIVETVEGLVNPFEYQADEKSIVNIYSGRVACPETSKDLQRAHSVGENSYHLFLQNLMSKTPDLFEPIQKNNLKTFLVKEKRTRDLLGRLLLLSNTREVDLTSLLNNSLSSLP
uniref:Uncharacterized protein n=2 Tax=Clytia hemisphaerica TaxID=252671 RepID=A0A7M5XG19_9CNID